MYYAIYTVLLVVIAVGLLSLMHYVSSRKQTRPEQPLFVPYGKPATTQMKGIAILIIIVGHLGNLFGIRYLNPLGSCGVAIFLFTSGYGLECSLSSGNLSGYWKKRLIAVYVPYVLFSLGTYPFLQDLTPKVVLLDLLLIDPVHPYGWYLQCLFLYYLAVYTGTLLERKIRYGRLIAVGCMAVLQFIFLRSLFKQQLFTYVAGVLFARFGNKKKHHYYIGAVISLFIGAAALLLKQLPMMRDAHWVIFYGVEAIQCFFLGMCIIFAVNAIGPWVNRHIGGALMWIGSAAYEIYLLHGYLMPDKASWISIAVFFVTTAIGSCLLHGIFSWLLSFLNRRIRSNHNARYSSEQKK